MSVPAGVPHNVVTADGVTLGAVWHAPPPGTPLRLGMLLLPALAAPARTLRTLATVLAGQGIGCLAADYRFTASSGPRPDRQHDASMATLHGMDVPALVAALEKLAPGVPLCSGGHSLGGQLSALALGTDGRVRAAVLITTSMPDESLWEWPAKLGPMLAFRIMPTLGRLMGRLPAKPLGMGEEIPRQLILDWGHWGRTGKYTSDGVDLAGILGGVTGPVLSVGASDDLSYAPKRPLDAFVGLMPRARPTMWMLSPQEMGVGALGHFGLLRTPAVEQLGSRLGAWLLEHVN